MVFILPFGDDFVRQAIHSRPGLAGLQPSQKIADLDLSALRFDFDITIRTIYDPSCQSEFLGGPDHEIPVTDSLDAAPGAGVDAHEGARSVRHAGSAPGTAFPMSRFRARSPARPGSIRTGGPAVPVVRVWPGPRSPRNGGWIRPAPCGTVPRASPDRSGGSR